MPANLTARYRKVEAAYRRATTVTEQLRCLEEMLRELPKHKGTDKLHAELKHKISKAKLDLANSASAKKGYTVRIPRQGAGQVLLIGGPNAGKSQLLRSLTRATVEVAPFPFTTREPNTGMMSIEDIAIQLVDTPPITQDYLEPYMQGLIRGADLVLFVIDIGTDEGIEQCQDVLDRLAATKTRLGVESRLDDADIGRSYTSTIVVTNKSDAPDATEREKMLNELVEHQLPQLSVSALSGQGLDLLRSRVFEALDIVRVYTKLPTRKEADFNKPFTLKRGGTISDVASLIHADVAAKLKFARVWGNGVHDGTRVTADYEVRDKDIVEIHTTV